MGKTSVAIMVAAVIAGLGGRVRILAPNKLLRAKWEKDASSEAPLLVFKGKIEGKSKYTRGVFICLNGITNDAQTAIGTGKERIFFVLNGHDLVMVLSGHISLIDFLRIRRRLLAEEGLVVVPFHELQIS